MTRDGLVMFGIVAARYLPYRVSEETLKLLTSKGGDEIHKALKEAYEAGLKHGRDKRE